MTEELLPPQALALMKRIDHAGGAVLLAEDAPTDHHGRARLLRGDQDP